MKEAVRINKFLSHNTKYSRREADKLIEEGRVKIGHKVVTDFSTEVNEGDKVFVDGNFVKLKTMFTVIVYNKQKGELVTKKDTFERKTIYDTLPHKFKDFIPVGRLDFVSEGLLLLTDSPDVATKLMTSDLERIYYVKVKGSIGPNIIKGMQEGLSVSDASKGAHPKSQIEAMDFKPFASYKIIQNEPDYSKLKVVITEGKNRELRRFFGYYDREVVELKRVGYGGIDLGMLGEGKWRFFEKNEYENLREFVEPASQRALKGRAAKDEARKEERIAWNKAVKKAKSNGKVAKPFNTREGFKSSAKSNIPKNEKFNAKPS